MPGSNVARFHLITDDRALSQSDFLPTAAKILTTLRGRVALHLRARELSAAQLYDLARALVAADPGAVLVNDRVDIAAATEARGVQLGARSLPIALARRLLGELALIGYSAHSAAEAAQAGHDGANFVLLGTIYRSESHPDATPAGVELIGATVRRCTLPVIAIGGITLERTSEVLAAGASGIAVIRAVWNAPDPVQAAHEFAKMLK